MTQSTPYGMTNGAQRATDSVLSDLGWDPDLPGKQVLYTLDKTAGTVRQLLLANEPYQGRMTSVFAWLGIPSTASPARQVPGIVLLHGGGGRAFRSWVEQWVARGYAAIAIDHAGGDVQGQPLADGRPPMSHEELFNPDVLWTDTWVYHAICACVRAHSILALQPQMDAARIGLTGISWGGYLTCIAAAVDPRLVCAASIYGCGYLLRNSADAWMECFDRMTDEQRLAWHARRDPAVYLPMVHKPLLFVSGLDDQAFPLDSLASTALLPAGPTTVSLRPGMEHSMEAAWAVPDVAIVFDHCLRAGPTPPQFAKPYWTADGSLCCEALHLHTAHRPRLVVTHETCRWQDRTWVERPARMDGHTVIGEVPAEASAAILLVEDDRGGIVSTLPQLRDARGDRGH